MARPDPSTPRKWIADTAKNKSIGWKGLSTNTACAVILFTDSSGGTTKFKVATWSFDDNPPGGVAMQMAGLYDGEVEECLGILSTSIIGAWVAPIPALNLSTASVKTHVYNGTTYAWYEADYAASGHEYSAYATPASYITDDLGKWVVVDPLGTIYATIPWGMLFAGYSARVDIGTSGAWVHIEFRESALKRPRCEGMEVQIPLPTVPITSNDLSDYVLSGQREYDRTMANLQAEQTMKSGIANAGTGAIGGAIAGSAAAPGIGTVAGLVGGAASSLLGTYFTSEIQKETDRKSMEAAERLMSNQAASAIIPSGGPLWWKLKTGVTDYNWCLMYLERDSVSKTELSDEQTSLGYITDAQLDDCSTLISTGGGLRIEGLEVKGNISPKGKVYIAALFARGVHLDILT